MTSARRSRRRAALNEFDAVEQVLGIQAGLDALGQLDLVGCGQQRHLADLVEVHPDQVGGGRGLVQVGERSTTCGRYPVIAGVRLDGKRHGVRGVERVGKATPEAAKPSADGGCSATLDFDVLAVERLATPARLARSSDSCSALAGWQIGIDNHHRVLGGARRGGLGRRRRRTRGPMAACRDARLASGA